jgi:calcium-dependent protein kinase
MSPQVLQGVYTSKADLWSCGVITYMLLSSHRPFYHKQREITIDRIMRASYSFEKEYWEAISSDAKNFINQLLVLDPTQRMDAGQALEHVWLSSASRLSDKVPDQLTSDVVKESLVNYKNTSQLTKIALNVIAHKVSNKGWRVEKHKDQNSTISTGNNVRVVKQFRDFGTQKSV